MTTTKENTGAASELGAEADSVNRAFEKVMASLHSLNAHIREKGLPAAVQIKLSDIQDCELPFPLKGNLAQEKIELFRFCHETCGHKVDIVDDKCRRGVLTITVSSQNSD